MVKRFAPFAGAIALMVGLMAGCQDSPTTGPDSTNIYATQADDGYRTFELDAAPLNDFGEIYSIDEAMDDALGLLPPTDTLRRDPPRPDTLRRDPPRPDTLRRDPPRPDTLRRDPPRPDTLRRDPPRPDTTGHLVPNDYARIIRQLNLTPAQDSLIRLCFADYRQCTQSAATRYRTVRQEAFQRYRAALAEIITKVAAGELTREQARIALDRLNHAYRQQVAELENAYRNALRGCQNEFESCVKSHLTAAQILLWERLTRR